MKINLTKKQYAMLLKMLYLGDWMINANRVPSDRDKGVDEVFSYMLSFAKDFGVEEMAFKNGEGFSPGGVLEEEEWVEARKEDYNEETFWDELIDRLADRDFFRRYSVEEVGAMKDWIERAGKRDEFEERYAKEFEEHGLERVEIRGNVLDSKINL